MAADARPRAAAHTVELDEGPIIAQGVLEVSHPDWVADLSASAVTSNG